MSVEIKGILEIDADRGVIYFHASEGPLTGVTQLRICRLPRPVPIDRELDITNGYGVSWVGKESPMPINLTPEGNGFDDINPHHEEEVGIGPHPREESEVLHALQSHDQMDLNQITKVTGMALHTTANAVTRLRHKSLVFTVATPSRVVYKITQSGKDTLAK
jgi:hypothetical protein